MITELKENQIFVFGSNLSGNHAGGAAKQAKEQFGAREGVGEGLTGQSYAFPTIGYEFHRFADRGLNLQRSRDNLYKTCREKPDKDFLLTKVGCGIAGHSEEKMKALFTNPPENLFLPEDWK